MKNIVKFILSWGLTLMIFVFLILKIDFRAMFQNLITMDFNYLMVSTVLLVFATLFLGVEKYRYILEFLGYDVNFKDVLTLRVGGLPVKFISPFKSGELVRLAYLYKNYGVSYQSGIYSLILNYLLRLAVLVIVYLYGYLWYKNYFILLSVFSAVFILVMLKYLNKNALFALIYSVFLEITLLTSYYFIFLSAGITLDLNKIFLFLPLILVTEALPVGVGGIGVRELGVILFFKNFADLEKLFAIGLIASFVNMIIPVFVGMLFMRKFIMEMFMNGTKRYNYLERRNKNPLTKYRINRRMLEILKAVEKIIRDKSEISVLDIGAADGKMLSYLKENLPVLKAVGVEPSDELRKAKKDETLEIMAGEGENLPFNSDDFDVVIIASVIEHVRDANRVLKEVYRVLKKNGHLIITFVNPFFDWIASHIGIKPNDHLRCYTKKQMKKVLIEKGFNIIETKSFGPFFYNIIIAEKL